MTEMIEDERVVALLEKLGEPGRKSITLGAPNMNLVSQVFADWLTRPHPYPDADNDPPERKTELRNLIIRSGAVSEQIAGHPGEAEIFDWVQLVQAELWGAYDLEVQR